MPRRAPERTDPREGELLALGLSRYQAAAYAALAALGPAGPRQVAEAANLPLARAYDALADLAGLGLAELVPARATTYRPLPVETLVDRELARVRGVATSLASERESIETEFAARPTPPEGFLLHPGNARFGVAARELCASGPASAVLLWPSAIAAFGGAAGVAAQPWVRLVLVASPTEVRAIARLRWRSPPATLPPGSVEAERIVAGGRALLRAVSGAGAALALETDDADFVEDAARRIAEAANAAARVPAHGAGALEGEA